MNQTRPSEQFEPNDMLNKTEVREIFMERLSISRTTYQECFREDLKFRSISLVNDRVRRIPYRVVTGLINQIVGFPEESDPSPEELKKFTTRWPINVPKE
ncbi:MAG: hypothetical protein GVY20_14415 [Bacteroidetes bacterium]|jgi:hypothetical protein|nr:hypothetical protein [Bacteroidota bacterium]